MTPDFMNVLLDSAKDIVLPYYRSNNLHVQYQQNNSVLTVAHNKIENTLRSLIKQSYPTHSITGQYSADIITDSEYCWLLCPLDDTAALLQGQNTFSTLITVLYKGQPILSGAGFHALAERYIATDKKTLLNGMTVRVKNRLLKDNELAYTDADMFSPQQWDCIEGCISEVKGVLEEGGAYNYCRMACGDGLIVMESGLKPVHFMPLIPIIKGAGGKICDWQLKDLHMDSSGDIIAVSDESYLPVLRKYIGAF